MFSQRTPQAVMQRIEWAIKRYAVDVQRGEEYSKYVINIKSIINYL
jgi:hypothetical protein